MLVVWKLDRLSRSLRDVLTIMERLAEAKAGVRSLTHVDCAESPRLWRQSTDQSTGIQQVASGRKRAVRLSAERSHGK